MHSTNIMTISALINSLAWGGSSDQPRLRTSLIKDQFDSAVYICSTTETWSLVSAGQTDEYKSPKRPYVCEWLGENSLHQFPPRMFL